MKSVDAWEVRGLKIFCILSAIVAGQAFVLRLLETNSLTAINVTQLGASVVWLLTALYAHASANAARYSTLLTVAMTATFIGVYVVTAADIMGFLERSGGESLIAGRAAEHTFSTFYALILLGVFLVRLRAVLVWFALCLVFPAQAVFAIAINPQVYFTNDHLILAADGNAINSGMFQQNLVIAILLAACLYSLTLFYRWALKSSVELEKSKENYRRYFSPAIGDEIENGDLVIGQDGSRVTDVAVLFTDIVGFTKLSERMDPQDVLDLLSEYQTLMVDAIFQHKGTVDKFIGDAVMANFGTPRSHGNDAQNAFDCGVLMNHKLAEWNKVRVEEGLSEIQHRIGIHYGKCVVGNMGSEQRLEFAVIGDAVNVASRICDACKNFDTNFLVSADVANRITHDVPSEDAPNVRVRGREGKIDLVKIYTERLRA